MKNENETKRTSRKMSFNSFGADMNAINFATFALVLFAACFPGGAASGGIHTINSISQGILEAEAQLTDLRLDYVFTHRAWDKPQGPKLVVECVYAHRVAPDQSKRQLFLERKHSTVNSQEQLLAGEHIVASFDGEATRILYRKTKAGKPLDPMKGYVLPGYKKDFFPTIYQNPHNKIWYFAGMNLGEFLRQHKDQFHIESQSEILNETSTVKLVGTWKDPFHGRSTTMKLWVSPERGFLPLKQQVLRTNTDMLSETALYDLIQLPNGLWYPRRILSPADPPGIAKPAIFHCYDIRKISIEPLTKEFFTLAFPPGTRVIDDLLKAVWDNWIRYLSKLGVDNLPVLVCKEMP